MHSYPDQRQLWGRVLTGICVCLSSTQ